MNFTKIADELPLVVIGDVLIPGSTLRVADSDERFVNLVKSKFLVRTMLGQSVIAVVPKTEPGLPLGDYGTAATVVQVTGTNWPKPFYSLLITGLCRIKISKIVQEDPFYMAKIEQLEPFSTDVKPQLEVTFSKEIVRSSDKLRILLHSLAVAFGSDPADTARFRQTLNNLAPHLLTDIACQYVSLTEAEKLALLSKSDVLERLKLLIPLVEKQISLAKSASKRISVHQGNGGGNKGIVVIAKPGALDELLKASARRRQMHDDDSDSDEKNEIELLENKIEALPAHVRDMAFKELVKLRKMAPQMPEYSISRNFLEFFVDLPWNFSSTDIIELEEARRILDAGHYGLEQIKQRLVEFLAVRRILSDRGKDQLLNKGPILCFVGPPGVGKTSIARSLAEVMRRKFQRISLGGVCDHADIRGHRRTYVGAMPGRILAAIKACGSKNPVILLDEVDKTQPGIHGDPAAALLEVLDAEQNNTFVDHYLNFPFDLSEVIFIATANSTSKIHPALLDRMEIINVPSYTLEEKVHIAEKYLFPKQIARHGLTQDDITLDDGVIQHILIGYTREAGVRQLERTIEKLCRKLCSKISTGDRDKLGMNVKLSDIAEILGPAKYKEELESSALNPIPGVCLGLAWTPMGGEVMHCEVSAMPGDGKLHLTGQLGDVIKESALLAFSWLRSRLGNNMKNIALDPQTSNIHVHLPAGAVAKDGPSAGLALLAAMVSLFAQTPCRSTVAVTGEITLRGYVLPVGGIREKLSAARRYGVKTVVLPAANEADVLGEVPAEIRQALRLVYVRRVENALLEILDEPSRLFSDALHLNSSHL